MDSFWDRATLAASSVSERSAKYTTLERWLDEVALGAMDHGSPSPLVRGTDLRRIYGLYHKFRKDNLLYRRWTPPGQEDVNIEQLVLPVQCRREVLRLVHTIPIAGHMGKTKTANRILQRFYSNGWTLQAYCHGHCRAITPESERKEVCASHLRLHHSILRSHSPSLYWCRAYRWGASESICPRGYSPRDSDGPRQQLHFPAAEGGLSHATDPAHPDESVPSTDWWPSGEV